MNKKEHSQDLEMFRKQIIEYAESIIMECNKWKDNPTAIARHRYAQEKVNLISNRLQEINDYSKMIVLNEMEIVENENEFLDNPELEEDISDDINSVHVEKVQFTKVKQ